MAVAGKHGSRQADPRTGKNRGIDVPPPTPANGRSCEAIGGGSRKPKSGNTCLLSAGLRHTPWPCAGGHDMHTTTLRRCQTCRAPWTCPLGDQFAGRYRDAPWRAGAAITARSSPIWRLPRTRYILRSHGTASAPQERANTSRNQRRPAYYWSLWLCIASNTPVRRWFDLQAPDPHCTAPSTNHAPLTVGSI